MESQESCINSCAAALVSEGSLLELSNRHNLRYLILAFGLQIDLPQYLPHLTGDKEIILTNKTHHYSCMDEFLSSYYSQLFAYFCVTFWPENKELSVYIYFCLFTMFWKLIIAAIYLSYGYTHSWGIMYLIPITSKWSLLPYSLHKYRYSREWCYINT